MKTKTEQTVTLRLNSDQKAELARIAASRGATRHSLLREAVSVFIQNSRTA